MDSKHNKHFQVGMRTKISLIELSPFAVLLSHGLVPIYQTSSLNLNHDSNEL